MAIATAPKLEIRTMIPPFELPSADGESVNVWQFKQQKNLVLVFLPSMSCPGCAEFVEKMDENCREYDEELAAVLVIVRSDRDAIALRSPLAVLYDRDGRVTEQYASSAPAVFVADRFGELQAEWQGRFPSQKEILDVVELINLECPE